LQEWINKAEEDYTVASILATQQSPTPNAVCFHCQQCCEKYLKAFLVKHQVKFTKTHDLLLLYGMCLPYEPHFTIINQWLNILTAYAVEYRYPGISATMAEAVEAVEAMKEVRTFIKPRL
jgi:HEPN domain-containing protein